MPLGTSQEKMDYFYLSKKKMNQNCKVPVEIFTTFVADLCKWALVIYDNVRIAT